jgi:hypothetical protein
MAAMLTPSPGAMTAQDFGAKCDGSTDDSGAIQTCLQQAGTCLLPACAAPYVVQHPIVVPSGAHLQADPATVIRSEMVGTSGWVNSVFYAGVVGVPGGFAAQTSAAAVAGQGIALEATPPPGAWLEVISPVSGSDVAEMVQVTPSGGFDRGIQRAPMFPAGSEVVQVLPPTDIELDFHGATISGQGDRAVELGACQRCRVTSLNVDQRFGQFSGFVISYDIGSSDDVFQNITIDGGEESGAAFECSYRMTMDNVRVQNTGVQRPDQGGVILNGCIACQVTAYVDQSGNGILATVTGPGDVVGTRMADIRGAYDSNLYYGALVETLDVDFTAASFSYNALGGVDYSAVGSGITGGPSRFMGVRSYKNGGPALTVESPAIVSQWVSEDDAGGIVWNGGQLDVYGGAFRIDADAAPYNGILIFASKSSLQVNGTQLELLPAPAHNEIAINDDSATGGNSIMISAMQVTGGTYSVALGLGGGTGTVVNQVADTLPDTYVAPGNSLVNSCP